MVGQTSKKRIVIVGGGFAGTKLALELSNHKAFEVVLLSLHSHFEYHGAMYRSATGRSPLEVVVPMQEIFKDSNNVRLELEAMTEIRPSTKEIETESGRSYKYDYLVIAVGCEVNYFGIPGMAENSENMYSISAAIKLRHRLVGAFRQAAQTNQPACVSIIGAGPTGVELAGDIHNFANLVIKKHELNPIEVKVNLVEASDRVLSMLSQQSSKAAQSRLEQIGVNLNLKTTVTECASCKLRTNRGAFDSQVTVWTAGNKAHDLFANYPDLFELNQRSRVIVNPYFQTKQPNIFVLGDAAATKYSGMAQTAIHNAMALADNLKNQAEGKHWQAYQPKQPEYVVPIGYEWALLEVDGLVTTGRQAWQERRAADEWVLNNFLVYDLAKKHYNQANQLADF